MQSIEVKGTESIGNVLAQYGKIVADGNKKRITLSIAVSSTLSTVAKSASVSSEDKESALDKMTCAEREAVAKFERLAKAAAKARVKGETSERWSSTVWIEKA